MKVTPDQYYPPDPFVIVPIGTVLPGATAGERGLWYIDAGNIVLRCIAPYRDDIPITGITKPYGVTIANGQLFFTDSTQPGYIGTVNLDGTGYVQHLYGPIGSVVSFPSDLANDGTWLYYVVNGGGRIGRAAMNGNLIQDQWLFPQGVNPIVNPRGLTVDSTYVYWNDNNGIGRAALDGSSYQEPWISFAGVNNQWIRVDSSHVYWNHDQRHIARANIDGSGANLAWYDSGLGSLQGIELDDHAIYVSTGAGITVIDKSSETQIWNYGGPAGPTSIKSLAIE